MALENEATPDATVENSAETPAPENWEQRAKDHQAAYTKGQQELAAERAVWEDENALMARIAEKYPHLVVNDEPDESEDPEEFVEGTTPPPADLKEDPAFKQQLQRLAALEEAEAERQYQADLNGLLKGREIPEKGRQMIRDATRSRGDNYKALEGAVNEWFELFPQESKSAATVVPGGKATLDAPPDYSEMSMHERHAAMTARALAKFQSQT